MYGAQRSVGYGQHLGSLMGTAVSGTELTEASPRGDLGSFVLTAGSTNVFMETWERWKCAIPAMNRRASIPATCMREAIPTTCETR